MKEIVQNVKCLSKQVIGHQDECFFHYNFLYFLNVPLGVFIVFTIRQTVFINVFINKGINFIPYW